MAHVPGQIDFVIEKKDFTVTDFQRRPSVIWRYVEVPGHIAQLTRRGKHIVSVLSVETSACLSGNYEDEIRRIKALADAYREERKKLKNSRN